MTIPSSKYLFPEGVITLAQCTIEFVHRFYAGLYVRAGPTLHILQSSPVSGLCIPDSTAEEHSGKGSLHLPIKLFIFLNVFKYSHTDLTYLKGPKIF